MNSEDAVVEIPVKVLASVETLDELEDWLLARDPALMDELRSAKAEATAGNFKEFRPRYV